MTSNGNNQDKGKASKPLTLTEHFEVVSRIMQERAEFITEFQKDFYPIANNEFGPGREKVLSGNTLVDGLIMAGATPNLQKGKAEYDSITAKYVSDMPAFLALKEAAEKEAGVNNKPLLKTKLG